MGRARRIRKRKVAINERNERRRRVRTTIRLGVLAQGVVPEEEVDKHVEDYLVGIKKFIADSPTEEQQLNIASQLLQGFGLAITAVERALRIRGIK